LPGEAFKACAANPDKKSLIILLNVSSWTFKVAFEMQLQEKESPNELIAENLGRVRPV